MAVYCRDLGLIYFAVPQTGSKATALTLREKLGGQDVPPKGGRYNSTQIGKHHATAKQLVQGQLLSQEEMDRLYKVGGVRNPWDLMVSRYIKHKDRFGARAQSNDARAHKWALANPKTAHSIKLAQAGDFPAWLDALINELRNGRICPSVAHFDCVIRFEHLQSDFDHVLAHVGVKDRVVVGEYNVTKERLLEGEETKATGADGAPPTRLKRDYTTYYDEASRKLIERSYDDWIQRFGYRFGEPLPA